MAFVLMCAAALAGIAVAAPILASGQDPPAAPVAIVGRVLDPDGQPIAGVRVAILVERGVRTKQCFTGPGDPALDCPAVMRQEGAVRGDAVSGPDGRFRLMLPSPISDADHFRADGVDARGAAVYASWLVRLNRNAGRPDLGDIRVSRLHELAVLVQGAGRPIADATVAFDGGYRTERTDERGVARYRFNESSPGSLRGVSFTVRAAGFADDAWYGGLGPASATHVVNLVADAPLMGRVVDPSGAPVSNVTVTLLATEPWFGPRADARNYSLTTERTDPDGRFVLRGANPARRYGVAADPPAGVTVADTYRTIDGAAGPLEITLPASGSVSLTMALPPSSTAQPVQRLLIAQLLGVTPRRGVDDVLPRLRMEWLNPVTGSWDAVFSPRRVDDRSDGPVVVHLDRVPAGRLRVITNLTGTAFEESQPFVVIAGQRSLVDIAAATSAPAGSPAGPK